MSREPDPHARLVGHLVDVESTLRARSNHIRAICEWLRSQGYDEQARRLATHANGDKADAARLTEARREWEYALDTLGETTDVYRPVPRDLPPEPRSSTNAGPEEDTHPGIEPLPLSPAPPRRR